MISGLEQPGIPGQVGLRMLAFAIAGVQVDRCRAGMFRRTAYHHAHTPNIARYLGLAFGPALARFQAVSVQAFGRHNMRLDKPQ